MNKIIYISPDNFFDVDYPVLKNLSKKYNITWIAILNKNSRFSIEEVNTFANENSILVKCYQRNFKKRSLKSLYFGYNIFSEVLKLKNSIVYLEYFRDIYFVFLSFLFLKKRHTVIAVHDVEPHKKIKYRIFVKFLDKLVFNYFTNFHFFSKIQKKVFEKKYFKKNSFFAPLMLKNFGENKKTYFNNENIEFLFFGTINYYKGLDYLLNSTTKLIENGVTNFRLTIAGNGDFWNECEKLIVYKNFYNCQIRFIPNSEIPTLFSRTHYLVLPYRDVTQSGVLFTSYFYKTPLIAPNFQEFRTYVKNSINGYLYNKNEQDGLYDCLYKIITNNNNNYSKIKKNLNLFISEKLDDKKVIEKYFHFFNKISLY